MFCQSCGQKNIDEARFCSFCGERIAAPGMPGGRVDVAPAPRESRSEEWGPGMTLGDSLALSLAGLGIKTRGRAYGFVVGLGLALMAIGGLVAYFVMRGGEAAVAETGHASPSDAFLVGAPIPEGLELPPYPDAPPPESPGPAARAASEAPRAITTNAPAHVAPPPPRATPAPDAPPPPKATPPAPEPPSETPAPAKPSQSPAPEPAKPSEAPEPPKNPEAEMELELYAGRVRFAVSRYYAGATRSCFEKATQSNATLSGTVVVATKVGADGKVRSASLARNSTGDQSLGECLVTQVRSFRLPPPPSGEIELKLPFSR